MKQPETPVATDCLGDSSYRRIVDSAIDFAIITFTDSGVITRWSRGAERVLGWTAQEMIGQPIHKIFTPEDVAAGVVDRELQQARDQPKAIDDRWHRRKSGELLWASGETMPLRDDAGRCEGFVKIVRDLTDQVKRTHDLEFFASACETFASGVNEPAMFNQAAAMALEHFADLCVVDLLEARDHFRHVARLHRDPARLTQLQAIDQGYPPGQGLLDDIVRQVAAGHAERVADMQSAEIERLVAVPQRREDLRSLGLRSCLVVPMQVQGETLGVILFASGESARRYTEEDLKRACDLARRAAGALQNARLLQALRDADHTKDVFLATLAHELRNPLAPIANGLSIIARVPGDRARVEQVTAMIARQVQQLTRLVDDLLDVSRIEAGKMEIKPEVTSLVSVLGVAVEMSRPHIEAAHHQLILSFTSEPTTVMADPTRLAQVFANLLNNAAKYTSRSGRIEVTVEAKPTEVLVRVRDNGAGIEAQMLRRVFGLFTQVPGKLAHRKGGLGIGLSLVEGLVRLHGGRVEARSEGLGKGSEFIVYLPRLVAQPSLAVAGMGTGSGNGEAGHPPRRVLVVDDNVDAAVAAADLLAVSGSEVDVVHDGRSAVEHTASFHPDVVLLDIGLPDISGYEAARRIRKLPGVHQPMLIALAGGEVQDHKQRAVQAGFDQHWAKPVDPQRLLALSTFGV